MERTVEDVQQLINLAKLDESELITVSQPLCFAENLQDDNIKLMEVDSSLLKKILEANKLVVRGEKIEHAVICTESSSFEVREAETSNSLLLVPQWSWPETLKSSQIGNERSLISREVTGIFHNYLELRQCNPRLKKLRTILEENPYQGQEYEVDNVGKKYTFEDLLNLVQASEEEIKNALKEIQACCIKGFWRILEFDYHFRILSFILNLVDSNSWPLDKIPKKILLDTLEELEPKDIIEQCFQWYADDTETADENGDTLFCLKEIPVCRFYAEVLLRHAGKFNLQEFLESWQKSVPEGMTTDLSQLQGLALTDLNSQPKVIFYFPSWNLPENIHERFTTLFRKREKWTFNDICPYICDLASETQNVNALLTKYTRTSTQNGIKLYGSKQPIS